jgi:hypothetical protein
LLTILGRFRHFEGDRVGGGRDDGVNFRNEANFGAGRGSWSGTRSGDLLRRAQGDPWLGFGWGAGGLDLAEVVEGAMEGALEALAAALQAGEGLLGADEGDAEDSVFGTFVEIRQVVFPEVGFGLAEAAEEPLGIDEDVDEGALGGGLGLVVEEVLGGQGVEGRGVFATDDLGLRVDAGFQGILGRGGLALSGARAGGFPGVQAVGLDLLLGCHK